MKVTVNMDGISKSTTRFSNVPMISKRLSALQRSRQVHPKELVAAIFTGLKDQFRTIVWLSSTTVGVSCDEEAIKWTTEDYENICDNITGKVSSSEAEAGRAAVLVGDERET